VKFLLGGQLAAEAFDGEWSSREIQEQTVFEIGGLEIASTDRKMNIIKDTDGFELHDDLAFNEKVEAMFTDLVIFVEQRDGLLPNILNAAQCKFNRERFFINSLKESWTKCSMNSNGRGNNSLGNLSVPQILSCFPAFLIHFLDRSRLAGLFPTRIMGEGHGWDCRLFY
jgi:hypothetical protein